ncbi:MAG: pantoate--beta-alanine ligase [Bacteroidota bacterium]
MVVARTKKEVQNALAIYRSHNHQIGFVPTMGALHRGHLSLVERALGENVITVVSIFINPTQFDNPLDLEKYPENLEKDAALLKALSPDILIFAPSPLEIYDGNVMANSYDFGSLEKEMEGAYRKGHFNGVATVVELLFKAVSPNTAYFGEKDFQQLQIIRKLTRQLALPITIIGCPIERESNGLARSSRNERLSKPTREHSGFILTTLLTAKEKFGTENAHYIRNWVVSEFSNHPLFQLEYFEIVEEETLLPYKEKKENIKYRAFIAVYAERIRLIDNIALN